MVALLVLSPAMAVKSGSPGHAPVPLETKVLFDKLLTDSTVDQIQVYVGCKPLHEWLWP